MNIDSRWTRCIPFGTSCAGFALLVAHHRAAATAADIPATYTLSGLLTTNVALACALIGAVAFGAALGAVGDMPDRTVPAHVALVVGFVIAVVALTAGLFGRLAA